MNGSDPAFIVNQLLGDFFMVTSSVGSPPTYPYPPPKWKQLNQKMELEYDQRDEVDPNLYIFAPTTTIPPPPTHTHTPLDTNAHSHYTHTPRSNRHFFGKGGKKHYFNCESRSHFHSYLSFYLLPFLFPASPLSPASALSLDTLSFSSETHTQNHS